MKSKESFAFCVDIIEGRDKAANNKSQDVEDLGVLYPNSVLGKILNKNKGQIIKTNPIILVPDEFIYGNLDLFNAKDFIYEGKYQQSNKN